MHVASQLATADLTIVDLLGQFGTCGKEST